MNNNVIYLASSSLSIFLANKHRQQFHKDKEGTLLIDNIAFTKFNHDKMIKFALGNKWDRIVDCSRITNDTKPTFLKRLTRSLKTKLLFRKVYHLFLQFYLKKLNQEQLLEFENKGLPKMAGYLYLLYDRDINSSLVKYVQYEEVGYYEHGIGDYHKWISDETTRNFYCVLEKELKRITPIEKRKFLHKINIENFPKIDLAEKRLDPNSIMFWILQPFEKYNVSEKFWISYTEEMMALMHVHNINIVLVKSHPAQSLTMVKLIVNILGSNGIRLIYQDDKDMQYAPAEFVLSSLEKEICIVTSLFSSSMFYMSNIEQFKNVTYYYSFKFFEPFARSGPEQFYNHFKETRKCFEGNFTQNLIDFSQDSSRLHKS